MEIKTSTMERQVKPVDAIDLKNRKISVMGVAQSGQALARVLSEMGANLLMSDNKSDEALGEIRNALGDLPLEWETGGHTRRIFEGRDMVIISPGVSIKHPILQDAEKAGVPVISEVEMAFLLAKAPFVAVTGTNGKSTTTTLIHLTLLASGKKSHLAGNIGIPLVGEVGKIPSDGFITAEISSFQLEAVDRFRPKVAALLNITVDHQDRHGGMDEYAEAKARLFRRQDQSDFAIFNRDDERVFQISQKVKSTKLFFSRQGSVDDGAFIENDTVKWARNGIATPLFHWKDVPLKGVHNQENVLAVVCVAMALNLNPDAVMEALQKFRPLHYRMEYVDEIGNVRFYNDSKGTNPDAVRASLDSFEDPVILIAGGTDKGLDFSPLAENIAKRAAGAVLIGESRNKIAAALKNTGFENYRLMEDMTLPGFKEAIRTAYLMAPKGGVVLLSPSCASFDMFKRAEHRGEMFNIYVGELKEEYEKTL